MVEQANEVQTEQAETEQAEATKIGEAIALRIGAEANRALKMTAKDMGVPSAHYAVGVLFGHYAPLVRIVDCACGEIEAEQFPLPILVKKGRKALTPEEKAQAKADAEALVARMQANEARLLALKAKAQEVLASGQGKRSAKDMLAEILASLELAQ